MNRVTREIRLFVHATIHDRIHVIMESLGDNYLPTLVMSEDTSQPNAEFFAQEALKERFGEKIFGSRHAEEEIFVVKEGDRKNPQNFRVRMQVSPEIFSNILNSPTCGSIFAITRDLLPKIYRSTRQDDTEYMKEQIFHIHHS